MAGIDLAIYSLYRFFRFTFFELVCTWLAAVPGHTAEARMFATGLIFTEEPANIKAIMSSNVSWVSGTPFSGIPSGTPYSLREISGPISGVARLLNVSGEIC